MTKVYIASPYTNGDQALNVRISLEAADKLIEHGFAPYAPLLSHFQHMLFPKDYNTWLKLDLEWLRACDIVLRLPGVSKGADIEVEEAKKLGKYVWYSLDKLLEYSEIRKPVPIRGKEDYLGNKE
jgi:hypothetical protein